MEAIKARFDQQFAAWNISFPFEDPRHRSPGRLNGAGWNIRYCFIEDNGRLAMLYAASHRMTNDTLNRIDPDGTLTLLDSCWEFAPADDPAAAVQFDEHNRRFYQQLEALGLG
ncbi:MAG TPA: hypothetical protein VHO48_14505 [Anaerolineaceae bacterium]|nr:hypothetical protein [Anaerolineaceae bacterium]